MLYDLRGPSMIVDTACSSSLTAAHLACQSLARRRVRLALVGGVQLMLHPGARRSGSARPRCSRRPDDLPRVRRGGERLRAWRRRGVVVLKPLAARAADGDPDLRGDRRQRDQSGRPHHRDDGAEPRRAGCDAASALRARRVAAADVHYVEAHGTGTPVGDPIEASAIGAVLGEGRERRLAASIGSVKTNIGHLEAAAGMAGLIKTALALYHRQIPPSLHFNSPIRPSIFRVSGCASRRRSKRGRAQIAGDGGRQLLRLRRRQRAHPFAGSPPAKSRFSTASARAQLLPISARSPEALVATATSFLNYLTNNPAVSIADICRTAALRRTHHEHRAAIVAASREEFIEALEALVAGEQRNNIAIGRAHTEAPPKLAFVFGGMGPQWWGMGRELMRDEQVFRETVERCDALLQPLAGWSLLELLRAAEETSRVGEADVAQVTNFAIQAGLTALWKSWGIEPDAVIGHSAGGIAAAHISGVHDLAQTMLLAFHRSRLQSRASGQGSMLAVALSAADAEEAIGEHTATVSLGAVNSPTSCSLTGNTATLEAIHQRLQERGVFSRMLQVVVPYHSAAMDPIEAELREVLRPLTPQPAAIGLVSDNTGEWADGGNYDAGYWWKTVREPVRFSEGIATLIDAGFETFVEVGPHPVLAASLTEGLAAKGRVGKILPSLRRLEDERPVMLRSLGALWSLGCSVRWEALHEKDGPFVKLPTYAWQRERHWYSTSENGAPETDTAPSVQKYVHPLLGARVRSPSPRWEARLGQPMQRWLEDHVVHDATIFPGAGYVEMALAVAKLEAPEKIAVPYATWSFCTRFCCQPGNHRFFERPLDAGALTIHSTTTGSEEHWTLHAQARIETSEPNESQSIALAALRQRCRHETGGDAY